MLAQWIKKMRRSAFELTLSDGRAIGETVLAPLVREGIEPLVVDVGARNGMQLLPANYCRASRLMGFEPNPTEYEKLIAKNTDAHKVGARIPEFQAEEYHPYAIWDSNGTHAFYITTGPGACTLMGHTLPQVTERMYLDYPDERRLRSFEQLHSTVKETIEVPCRTLDEVVGPNRSCDLLKLDVEGAEMRCLKGAKQLLADKRVLFVYTEFVAFPYYSEHCVLGDQHALLNNHGLRLLDIEMGHSTYRRGIETLPISADRRMLHAGDAFFCLDPDRNNLTPQEKQRIAALCLIFGFNSFALALLREAALLDAQTIGQIHKIIANTYTIPRLKQLWKNPPMHFMKRMSL